VVIGGPASDLSFRLPRGPHRGIRGQMGREVPLGTRIGEAMPCPGSPDQQHHVPQVARRRAAGVKMVGLRADGAGARERIEQ
jgi:hypothetical protein